MDTGRERCNRKHFMIIFMIVGLGLGCLCTPTGLLGSNPPPTKSLKPSPPAVETQPPVKIEPTGTPLSNRDPLTAQPPWLLVETDQGLWAVNLDGTGLVQLNEIDYWDYNLPSRLQPHGSLVAFISPDGSDLHHMSLNLLSVPTGTITKVTDLTSPETEAYADLEAGEARYEALSAVRDWHNLAWSPDGRRLAFTGVMDGPTAEIYTYDTISGAIQRISTDDSQDYWPSWSPDGETLLFFGTDSFSSGIALATTGVWSARGEDLIPTLLYRPTNEDGAEHLLGWLNATTAILINRTPAGDSASLRMLDIPTNESTMLEEGWVRAAAVDSWRGALLYASSSGLYLLTSPGEVPVKVSEQEVEWIPPVDPGEYFLKVYFTDGSLATYGTSEYDYGISPISVPINMGGQDVSAWGWIWLWTSTADSEPGAWVTGQGAEVGRIFDDPAGFPMWDQDSNLFFFGVEGVNAFRLYRATFDAFYSDVMELGFIDAAVRSVGWLGNP